MIAQEETEFNSWVLKPGLGITLETMKNKRITIDTLRNSHYTVDSFFPAF